MIKDDYDEARKSLRFYRRKRDVEEELREIQVSVTKPFIRTHSGSLKSYYKGS